VEFPLTLSPYAPPNYPPETQVPSEVDRIPQKYGRVAVWGLRVLSLLLIPLGFLGWNAAFSLRAVAPNYPAAYQQLLVSAFGWLLSIPIVIVCLLICKTYRKEVSFGDKLWFYGWAIMPTFALVLSVVAWRAR
jgi:hypothetical protein